VSEGSRVFVGFLGKIDRALEVNDDFLCSFLPNSWHTCEELIILQFYGSHDVLTSESQDILRGFPPNSIDGKEFAKEVFFTLIVKAKQRLRNFGDMVVEAKCNISSDMGITHG
jgi:hypothetical protein